MSIFFYKKWQTIRGRKAIPRHLPVMANIVVMMEKPELDTLIGGLAMVDIVIAVLVIVLCFIDMYVYYSILLVKKDTMT